MTKSESDQKINRLQQRECSRIQTTGANYCVPGLMSRCGAGASPEKQRKCRYFKKSTVSNRCMHYIEAIEGHCDCLEAQNAIKTAEHEKEDDEKKPRKGPHSFRGPDEPGHSI